MSNRKNKLSSDVGVPSGKFKVSQAFRDSLTKAVKNSRYSREELVLLLHGLTGLKISKQYFDQMTAQSKVDRRFPAELLPALCYITGDTTPLRILADALDMELINDVESRDLKLLRLQKEKERLEKRDRGFEKMKLTAKQISEKLFVSERAVCEMAERENWPFLEECNKDGGKSVKYFLISDIPADIRNILLSHNGKQEAVFVRNDVWLTVKETAKYLGISERAVRKNILNGKYIVRRILEQRSRGGLCYEVALSSLGRDAQVQWVLKNQEEAKNLPDSVVEKFDSAAELEICKLKSTKITLGDLQLTDEEKEKLHLILKMINEAKVCPAYAGRKEHIKKVAEKYGVGRSTLENYITIYNRENIAGLKKRVSKKRCRQHYGMKRL